MRGGAVCGAETVFLRGEREIVPVCYHESKRYAVTNCNVSEWYVTFWDYFKLLHNVTWSFET